MATTLEKQWNQGMRRTATFHLLHEAALLKETAGTPTLTLATAMTTQHSAMVHDEALTELHCLQALPPSSHKWTWGKQLTEQEVLCLRRTGTRPGRTPHSGYDVSLIEGRMLGKYSQTQSHPTSHGHPEEVASSIASIPPSTNLDIPSYFSQEDRRTHDRLHVAQPSSLQRYLPSKSVSAQSLPVLEPALESTLEPVI